MEQHLHFITLATRDLDAARAFYQEGLGWTPRLDVPGEILFFQVAPGLLLGLFDAGKFSEDLYGRPLPVTVSGITLSHNVDSPTAVEETVATMARLGGTVITAPRQAAFGGVYHAHVSDPNGVVWEIAHNPAWNVLEDGTVHL